MITRHIMKENTRISMDLELKDIPGQLALALIPLAEFKGNLVGVFHHREKRSPRGRIPVNMAFEIDPDNLPPLLEKLARNDITVARVNEDRLIEQLSLILIGHIVHTDIKDTIDAIDQTGSAEVIDLSLSMPRINGESSAHMIISATGKKELEHARSLLLEIAKRKDLLVIEPIGIDGGVLS